MFHWYLLPPLRTLLHSGDPLDRHLGTRKSGASWMDLVDITVFLTNMKADFKTYNRIYAEYFKDNQPCRTTLEILSLPTPIAIEVKAIAYVGPKA